jgi:hypothetical protein
MKCWCACLIVLSLTACATTDVYVEPSSVASDPNSVAFVLDLEDEQDDDLGVSLIIQQELLAHGYSVDRVWVDSYEADPKKQTVYLTYSFNAIYDVIHWTFETFQIVWQDWETGRLIAQGQHTGDTLQSYRTLTKRIIREMLAETKDSL